MNVVSSPCPRAEARGMRPDANSSTFGWACPIPTRKLTLNINHTATAGLRMLQQLGVISLDGDGMRGRRAQGVEHAREVAHDLRIPVRPLEIDGDMQRNANRGLRSIEDSCKTSAWKLPSAVGHLNASASVHPELAACCGDGLGSLPRRHAFAAREHDGEGLNVVLVAQPIKQTSDSLHLLRLEPSC